MLVVSLKKKTDFNTKVAEIEGKMPSISTSLATNSELSALENKIPDVCSLVEKTNLNALLKKLVIGSLQINLDICKLKMN